MFSVWRSKTHAIALCGWELKYKPNKNLAPDTFRKKANAVYEYI